MTMPVAVTLAGNDPGGGPGLPADVNTSAAFGVYGMAVLTVATDGNTDGNGSAGLTWAGTPHVSPADAPVPSQKDPSRA